MKARICIPAAIIGLLVFSAWTYRPFHTIKKAAWLIGTWENKTPRRSLYETWSKTNDHTLSGKSYMIKEKDTVIFETVQIIHKDNNLYYIPTVANQNGGLPVTFTGKSISDSLLVFENPEHDFPQLITYKKISEDSLIAEISGMKNGKERRQSFGMKRKSEL